MPPQPVVVAVMALALSAPVFAQPAPQGRVPLGSSVSFTPSVVVVGGYDTNRLRTTDGTGDNEMYIAPQVEGWLGRGRTTLNVVGAIESQRLGQAPTLNNYVAAQAESGTRILKFRGRVGRRDHEAPPTDFVGFELGIRSRRVEKELTGTATFTPGRFSLGAGVERSLLRYDADQRYAGSSLRDNLNHDTTWTSLSAGVALTPLTSLSSSVSFVRQSFLFAPARNGSGYRALAGASFDTAALVSGFAMAGVLSYETTFSKISYQGPTYLVGLNFSRGGSTVRVSGLREIGFSFDPSRGFYLATGGDLYSTVTVARRWQPFLRTSIRGLTPQGPARDLEPYRGIQLLKTGLVFRVTRWARVGTEWERYVYGGVGGFRGARTTVFLMYGSDTPQRLDRPLPGQF